MPSCWRLRRPSRPRSRPGWGCDMELVTAALMVWAFAYAVENAKSQWQHTRDGHARTITSQHPMWHPRKVRRHATWRALGWWAHEAKDAFPTIRRAWDEDREHVRYLRAGTHQLRSPDRAVAGRAGRDPRPAGRPRRRGAARRNNHQL